MATIGDGVRVPEIREGETETTSVAVSMTFEVKLIRVVWTVLTTEDYHVYVGAKNVGMVGLWDAGRWTVTIGGRELATSRPRVEGSSFVDRQSAVRALVRHAARKGLI
jgi:hypothetical protein